MRIQTQFPCLALTPYVHAYHEIRHDLPADVVLEVPFGATGRSHFVFSLESPFQCRDEQGKPMAITDSTLFVQLSRPYLKRFCGPTLGLVLDFTPVGLHALWPLPLHELSEHSYDLTAVINRDIRRLTEQLREATTTGGRFAQLEAFLLRRLACVKPTDGRLDAAVQLIQQRPGHVDLKHVAWQLNCSERTLRRRFAETVGHSPKYHARIQRFLQTWRSLKQTPQPDWSALLQAGNYYDQAHLINEFRYFAGNSPRHPATGQLGLHDALRES